MEILLVICLIVVVRWFFHISKNLLHQQLLLLEMNRNLMRQKQVHHDLSADIINSIMEVTEPPPSPPSRKRSHLRVVR
jgi:hypothetical protein